ncbi:unnamed protein product [Euphydryas editha]|uniref:Uncharacterized protein n=1 Tax=Euphydryas editha TaxID=104508 RepID=A0AAU9TAW2_EUPED|nr:unnamed protein product [Euphydryas editha]
MDIDLSNSNMDLGSLIKDQVAKSMKNVDVMALLQKMATTETGDEESGEIQNKLQGILKSYNNMPENLKAEFTEQLKDLLVKKLATKLKDTPVDFSGVEDAIKNEIVYQLYLIGAGVVIFIVVLVFFGYKLYKSIKEKEKKREEKKKLKQMKKKK